MKVIMLDIDGVLATEASFERDVLEKRREEIGTATITIHRYPLDPKAVDQLNSLTKESGAKLVISSSWRLLYTLEELKAMLAFEGVKGEIIDETPIMRGVERGVEIATWINSNPVEAFVILDDDADMGELMPWLVQTDFERGLDSEDVQKALYMLGEYA